MLSRKCCLSRKILLKRTSDMQFFLSPSNHTLPAANSRNFSFTQNRCATFLQLHSNMIPDCQLSTNHFASPQNSRDRFVMFSISHWSALYICHQFWVLPRSRPLINLPIIGLIQCKNFILHENGDSVFSFTSIFVIVLFL